MGWVFLMVKENITIQLHSFIKEKDKLYDFKVFLHNI